MSGTARAIRTTVAALLLALLATWMAPADGETTEAPQADPYWCC